MLKYKSSSGKIVFVLTLAVLFGAFFLVWSHSADADNNVTLGTENKNAENQSGVAIASSATEPQIAPSELIIKFKKKPKVKIDGSINIQDTGVASINKRNEAKKTLSMESVFLEGKNLEKPSQEIADKGLDRVYKLKFPENADVQALVQEYKQDQNVEYAQPNYVMQPTIIPNDTYYISNLWGMAKIRTYQAWDVIRDSANVTVAVVDTGTDYGHVDLAANIWNNPGETGMTQVGDRCWTGSPQDKKSNNCDDDNNGYTDDWHGWNYVDNNNNPMDLGFQGTYHGTHVSGTISAVGNNNTGVVGVNWNAKIMPLRICDTTSGCYTNYAASAIRYAADNGAKVINDSWGGQYVQDDVVRDAMDYAHAKGVVIVNAAGNNSKDVYSFSPANINSGIAVSATDSSDNIAGFSNWGSKVDVSAPGVSIYSTYNSNGYQYLDGTSMAAPHVAGLAALILAHDPTLTNEEVRQILKSSADDLGAAGGDTVFGYGRINAYKAVTTAKPPVAFISSPTTAGIYLNSAMPIIGTANGATFQSYKIEYGAGTTPSSWTQIATGSSPIQNGILGTLNAQQLNSGTYVMRLTVTDTQSKQYQFQSYFDVLTGPMVPESFSRNNSSTSIDLAWVAPLSQFPIAGYQIYRSENADFSNPTIFTTSNTTYNDSAFQVGHTYYYKVRAYDNQTPINYGNFTNTIVTVRNATWWMHKIGVNSAGIEGNNFTISVSRPSTGGRYVAFSDGSTNLVDVDSNGNKFDIFFKDIFTNTLTMISLSTQGVQGNNDSFDPEISADGRYVVFSSDSNNLVSNDTNGKRDIFLRDTQQNTTTIVSVSQTGVQNSFDSNSPKISADGQYATYTVTENVAGKTNIYRKNLQTGAVSLVSSNSSGTAGNQSNYTSSISTDGRYISFDSSATNLVAGNAYPGIYFKDMQTGVTELISVGADTYMLHFNNEEHGSISDSGRYVVFLSEATHLVGGETASSGVGNVYLRDRQAGTTRRISKAWNGDNADKGSDKPKISPDGRYVYFNSDASNIIENDSNGVKDAFIYDTSSNTVKLLSADLYGSLRYIDPTFPSGDFSADGKFVTYMVSTKLPDAELYRPHALIRTIDGTPGPLKNISITPSTNQTITVGQTIQFSAQGQDENGTSIPSLAYTWTGTDQNGFFDGSTAGTYSIKATANGMDSPTVNITVSAVPAVLTSVSITPNSTQDITAGQTVQFSAHGKDQYGNDMTGLTYVWSETNSSGLFGSTSAGTYQVKVSSGGIDSPTVAVNVAPAALDHIYITPDITQPIRAGETVQFVAHGQDQFGNEITGLKYIWFGGPNEAGLFSETFAGEYQIMLYSDDYALSSELWITVDPSDTLDHVEIYPDTNTNVSIGEELDFIAVGRDQYGNYLPNLTYTWEGTDQNGIFLQTSAGVYSVKASRDGKSSPTINVTVIDLPPAAPSELSVQ